MEKQNKDSNWALFWIVVSIIMLLTFSFSNSIDNWVFLDIYNYFHYYFEGFWYRIMFNPYVLSVWIFLWIGFKLSKNKSWKNIIISLIVLNLLITGYKLIKIRELNIITEQSQIKKAINTQENRNIIKENNLSIPEVPYIKNAPKANNITENSVILEWESIPNVRYIIEYSKKSVANSIDTNSFYEYKTEPIITSNATVTWLEPNTNYYFVITVIDNNGNESSIFSDELGIKTSESYLDNLFKDIK